METKITAETAKIPDSGNRTELIKGGGLRDIQPENGRCDLLPLGILADVIHMAHNEIDTCVVDRFTECDEHILVGKIFALINKYIYNGTIESLKKALIIFMLHNYSTEHICSSGDNKEIVVAQAISTGILELSKRYREGAEKYAERNWEKGIPIKSCLDSGIRHLLKWHRMDADENHASAFMWNIVGAIWMHTYKPDCIGEMPFLLVNPDICLNNVSKH